METTNAISQQQQTQQKKIARGSSHKHGRCGREISRRIMKASKKESNNNKQKNEEDWNNVCVAKIYIYIFAGCLLYTAAHLHFKIGCVVSLMLRAQIKSKSSSIYNKYVLYTQINTTSARAP